MKILLTIFFISFISIIAVSQSVDCYPTSWFTGMKSPKLQIIIHAKDIGNGKFTVNYPGVTIEKVNRVENQNYAILDLNISPSTAPGKMTISVSNAPVTKIVYELRKKNAADGKSRVRGVTSSDFIYLIMPDRFSNGDPSNDAFPDMQNSVSNRNDPFARHGGDLKGIENHLDYFSKLGVTTLWLTPVVENDMPLTDEGGTKRSTYHGYAFTNQYQVDRRLGGNDAYMQMINAAHAKGLKVIQDAVYNHVGDKHWSIQDMPMKDWVHQWPSYTNTSYKEQPIVDPYASELDREISLDGWFTRFMPDLNQKNPFVANFLIQYAIWATENFGIDGWRVDTYFYNDPIFLNRMNDALLREFPTLTVFGETLVPDPVNAAYFSQNNLNVPFKHNLQGVTDQPLSLAMKTSLTQNFGGSEGMGKFYQTLAQDFLYKNPMRNCVYLDNHDLDRFYSVVGEDFDKYKMGITMLLTIRGIPQLYYGTEILMKNFKDPSDAEVRRDFPGGWPGDPQNKFEAAGRNEQENRAFDFVSTLAHFRQHSSALKEGKTLEYVPESGVFTYFRYNSSQTIMVVLNSGNNEFEIVTSRFEQALKGFSKARNVMTNESFNLKNFKIPAKESLVLELLK